VIATYGGGYGQPGGQCLLSNGAVVPCPQQPTTKAPAPSSKTPWYNNPCVTNNLLKGAGSTALDSLGLIGPAGGVARFLGHQAGYRGIVADQYGSKVVGAASKAWSGASFSASAVAGALFDTPEDAASTVTLLTGLVPFLSQASAVYASE
jgi:hypothetical protein